MYKRKGLAFTIWLVLVWSATLACSARPSVVLDNRLTSDVVPPSYTTHENLSHGFAISIPGAWVVRTDAELKAEHKRTVAAARSYGSDEVKELPDNATELVFMADNGHRGPKRRDVIVYINKTRSLPYRGPASPWFEESFQSYHLHKEELGKISGKDAGIHDYQVDQVTPWTGVQRLVILSVEFLDVMCPAYRFPESGTEGSFADSTMAETCWEILRTFRLDD